MELASVKKEKNYEKNYRTNLKKIPVFVNKILFYSKDEVIYYREVRMRSRNLPLNKFIWYSCNVN